MHNLTRVFGGQDTSFPISYNVCPTIQSFSLPLHQQQMSDSVKHIMSLLCSTLETPSSTTESNDHYFDAHSHISGPASVRSSADLQSLLPSHATRAGGFGRTHSSVSLTNLTLRSRSHVNLRSARSRSHTALSHYSHLDDTSPKGRKKNVSFVALPKIIVPKPKSARMPTTPTKFSLVNLIRSSWTPLKHILQNKSIWKVSLLLFILAMLRRRK